MQLRDELTGATHQVTARTVVNATGVWAGDLVDEVRLRPSRGTHLVLREETLPGLRVVVYAPIPGSFNRFVLVLPQPDGTIYVGLTDEPADGPVPDVPAADRARDRLPARRGLGRLRAPDPPHRRGGRLRRAPSAARRPAASGETADISRRHAVLTSRTGVVTIVGGKLTTYRRMAEDAVDAALAHAGIDAGPCRTRALPLLGAADRATLAGLELPARLVRRFGTDAELVLETARTVTGLGRRRAARADRRRRPGRPWPSWSSASPTRAPPTSTTCSTGVPGSAWSRPTGPSPCPPPSGRWRWRGRRL